MKLHWTRLAIIAGIVATSLASVWVLGAVGAAFG